MSPSEGGQGTARSTINATVIHLRRDYGVTSRPPLQRNSEIPLTSWFFGFGAGIVGSRRAIEAAAFEQRLDVRIASDEILEQP